jgi:hypothetical protein
MILPSETFYNRVQLFYGMSILLVVEVGKASQFLLSTDLKHMEQCV